MLQQAGNSAFVIQFEEKFYAFPIHRVGGGIISLFPGQASQVGECASNTPTIVEFPKDCQTLFIQYSRACTVTLFAGEIPLVVYRPGNAGSIAQFPEN